MLDLELRKKGIGGSEIAAVLGINPWSSPQQVWARKLGLEPEPEYTPAMRRGWHLESGIISWLAENRGIVVSPGTTLQSKAHPICIATPDGFARETAGSPPFAVVEVKAPGPRQYKAFTPPEESKDGIPDYYLTQITWEMAAAELDKALFAALIGGDLWEYQFAFDAKLFRAMYAKAEAFQEYVEKKQPPPVTTTEGAKWIREFHAVQTDDGIVDLSGTPAESQVHKIVEAYDGLKEKERENKDQAEIYKGKLIEIIGPRAGLKGRGFKVTFKQPKDSEVTDWKAVALAAGASESDIAANTLMKHNSRRFLADLDD
jgi:putative phage-type endonuclease